MKTSTQSQRHFHVSIGMIITLVIVLTVAFGPRTTVVEPDISTIANAVPSEPRALPAYFRDEAKVARGLDPNVTKRIMWADSADSVGSKTPLSVVYLHGFSATRQETAPFSEKLAQALGANLVETRLTGHGQPGAELNQATATDWMRDAIEAFTVAQRVGDSVVVVATSTGGTLALWLAMLPPEQRQALKALVLISPNLGIKDPSSRVLLWPWASVLLPHLSPERRWTPRNDEQKRYWTTTYPTTALLPMAALVKYVNQEDPKRLTTPTLLFLNQGDNVVNSNATRAFFGRVNTATVDLVDVQPVSDEDQHVIVGRITAPSQVTAFLNRTFAFLRAL